MRSPIPIPGAPAPVDLISSLDGALPHAVALDGPAPEGWGTAPGRRAAGHGLFAGEPAAVFRGGLAALDEARRWLDPAPGSPAHGAVIVGYLGYELGSELDRIGDPLPAEWPDDLPLLSLFGYEAVYRRDAGGAAVHGRNPGATRRLAEHVRAVRPRPRRRPRLALPRPRLADAAYLDAVRRIRGYIAAGDVYQVNLARRLDGAGVPREGLPALFQALTARAAAPFSAYLDLGAAQVLSVSPERFLRVAEDRVETCPIKGTRPRGRAPEQDRLLAKELLASGKDRAEHVMIVDLSRNDLGRVCRIGSVRVERFAELRSFGSVHHLVSSVQGSLHDPGDWRSLLAATFPGGSITGAPKLRAMEIIQELEPVRRGVYTGAIGCFDAAGGIDLSIAIRTAIARDGRLSLHVGGGIVADSDPDAELAETRDKAGPFAALAENGA